MGDLSAEPSMEEILSSIKRIIQEEGEGPARGRRAGRAAPPPPAVEDEEVLELSDPMPPHAHVASNGATHVAAYGSAHGIVPAVEQAPDDASSAVQDLPEPFSDHPDPEPAMPQPAAQARTEPAEPLLSRQTAEASRSALDNLSRLLVKPEPGSDGSLEGLVREMLRPMLRDWLDANLPAMVERMVEGEIARITGASR